LVAALALAAYVALAWPGAWRLPFMGDDFVFLDAAARPLPALFSPHEAAFGWWRPWSRGFHYWTLLHVAGPSPLAFRIAGVALWITALLLFGHLARRVLEPRAAAVAVFGAAGLGLWGAPLLWIPGVQDLWMLVLALATLALIDARRDVAATASFALALLSKETAAVVPLIAFAWLVIAGRESPRGALRRLIPLAAVTIAWALLHPTLFARLGGRYVDARANAPGEAGFAAPVRALLALANLSPLPRPTGLHGLDFVTIAGAALVLAAGAWLAARVFARPPGDPPPGRVAPLALAWTAAGWLPLLAPSIGWHAYYGALGSLGAWLGIAAVLARVPAVAFAALCALGVLGGLGAHTVSWDWGDAWYQQRAASWQEGLHERLHELHPSLPPHTRVWFIKLPNNVGLVAGASSAMRLWYDDPTLRADYYSRYRPRTAGEPAGPDVFVRYDPERVLVEIATADEDPAAGQRENPEWTHDHFNLARQMVRAGDWRLAGAEYAKLGRMPDLWPPALYAGVCWDLAGMPARADSLLLDATRRSGLPPDSVRTLAAQLRHEFVWKAAGAR